MMVDLHPGEIRGYWKQQDPDLWFKPTDQEDMPVIQKPSQVKEIRRSGVMDLLPGESRGYWKHYAPGKWFRQAKITGRTRIKITMTGSLVYFFDIWVGDLAGQDAILGMDFMVPAGGRPELAYGSISLPDEVRIQLSGRRQLYSDKARLVTVGEHIQIEIGQSVELQLHLRMSDHEKFWVTRGIVGTVVKGLERRRYLQITNVSDKAIILQEDVRVGIWLAGDHIPRMPGFVSIGSRRYMEWQNLALEATVERRSEHNEILMGSAEPMVDRPSYPAPRAILNRDLADTSKTSADDRRSTISGDRSARSHPDPTDRDRGDKPNYGSGEGG
ncbi:hypothetical protein PHPALM_27519 [Phytophthora palmivora]|uniref:Aspartic protease n=1 Tax=Phytophthora palmivora TaxID=4796 RepID=A0A2P4XCF0_9STRA|nr:hypothetical protein PHPALM_27519 [Phytophthora palmivora]